MIGLNKGEVRLSASLKEWKELYKQEEVLLKSLIGDHIVDVEHIGSTAIDGIHAKPMIDILVGVQSFEDVAKFEKERLKEHGYYHLARVQIEGKVVFARFSNLETLTKTHVLHIVEYNGEWWQQHTFFRDFLRDHPSVAKEYEDLKLMLAKKYPTDEVAYTNEKKQFVDEILRRRK